MPLFDEALDVAQTDAPGTPATGRNKIAVGTDGLPYLMTPTGVKVPLSIGDVATALHSNASFETVSGATPTVWDTFIGTGTLTTETTDVLFGTRSATVTTAAGSNFQSIVSDTFTVAPGDTVTHGAWAHKITGSPKMAIGILTAPSGTPAFFDGNTFGQGSEFFPLATTYTRYDKTFLVPAGHTVARMYLWFAPTASEACTSRVDFTTSSRTGASTAILPGNSWTKEACRAAIFAPVTVAGGAPSTVDGVALAVGDRVLHAPPGLTSTGIYVVTNVGTGANGTWVRASDATTSAQFAGAEVAITSGTVFGGSRWGTTFKATDTVGTSAMWWDRLGDFPGMVKLFAGSTPPTGWLLCDGASLTRASFAPLFAAIGTTYGAANAAVFSLPNLKGRVPVGVDAGQLEFDTLGEIGGAKTHTLVAGEMPSHTHVENTKALADSNTGGVPGGDFIVNGGGAQKRITSQAVNGRSPENAASTGGGGAHNNLQPYIALNYIIKT